MAVLWHENSKLNFILTKKMGNFSPKNLICALGELFRPYAHALRFAVDLHGNIEPRNSIQLLKMNTTKFQMEREPVYHTRVAIICFWFWFCNQQDSFTNMIADIT